MFECKDVNGERVHIEDIAELVEVSPMGLPVGSIVIVVNLYDSEEIKICPEEVGVPEIVSPESIKVNQSFITELEGLASHEELQDILHNAEVRYVARMAGEKEKKKAKKKENTEQIVLDI